MKNLPTRSPGCTGKSFAAEAIAANERARVAKAAGCWNDVRKHYAVKDAALSQAIVAGMVSPEDVHEQILPGGHRSLVIKVIDGSDHVATVHSFENRLTAAAQERLQYLIYAGRM